MRAAAAFLTFFMGVSLTLGSLCGAVGRRAIGSDYAEWWQNDWQETPVFRNRISNDLESFLTIGVGRTVDWYHIIPPKHARAYTVPYPAPCGKKN